MRAGLVLAWSAGDAELSPDRGRAMIDRRSSTLALAGWALVGATGPLGLLTPGLLGSVVVGVVVLVLCVRLDAPHASAGIGIYLVARRHAVAA